MMLDGRGDEIEAHLTCIRFVLEVILANWFAGMEPAVRDAFLAEMERKSRMSWSRNGEANLATAQRATELTVTLLDAAVERSRGR